MLEFAEFLGSQPPFDNLDADDLERLARTVQVEYFAAGTVIIAEGSAVVEHLFVVRAGEVEIVDRSHVVDILGAGDTFGHVSLLSGLRPALSARASQDSLCYQLPDPRRILTRPERLRFGYFGTMIARERLTGSGLLSPRQAAVDKHMRPIVWGTPTMPAQELAMQIGKHDNSCALIDLGTHLGIVTDRDFRALVADGRSAADLNAGEIATSPAIAISKGTSLTNALLRMVEACVHHLVVEDANGHAVGIIRAIDVASVEVRDPLLIRSAIEVASTIEELAEVAQLIPATVVELHDNGVPPRNLGALHATLIEAVMRQLVALLDPGSLDPVPHSWLVLGSMARQEPLPGSDVDTAIVWSDSAHTSPADQRAAEDPAARVRATASTVIDAMRRCGLRPCPDGANADNPLFSRSRSAWQQRARSWLENPSLEGALLLAAIAADSRPITNPTIGRTITDAIRDTTRGTRYLDAALRHALAVRPPLGFVRNFVVEHTGEQRGRLDLKRGGLMPVSSLARWLAVAMGEVQGSTVDRLARATTAGILTSEESGMLTAAFDDIYAMVLEREVAAVRAGHTISTWLDPRDLDTLARRQLRESFRAIGEVQTTIETQWRARL